MRKFICNNQKWIGLILLILIIIACTRCQAYKDRICSTCPRHSVESDSTSVKDTTTRTEKVTPRIEYRNVPGPIQYMSHPCADLCDSLGKLKPFFKSEKKNGITSTLKSVGDVLVSECYEDSLKLELQDREITINHLRETISKKDQEITKQIVTNEPTGLQWFWIWSGRILWVLLLLIAIRFAVKAIWHI